MTYERRKRLSCKVYFNTQYSIFFLHKEITYYCTTVVSGKLHTIDSRSSSISNKVQCCEFNCIRMPLYFCYAWIINADLKNDFKLNVSGFTVLQTLTTNVSFDTFILTSKISAVGISPNGNSSDISDRFLPRVSTITRSELVSLKVIVIRKVKFEWTHVTFSKKSPEERLMVILLQI